jgi:hypothetical protein
MVQPDLPQTSNNMKTIYKYPIKITAEQEITMPDGANVIHAGLDLQGEPCVWAQVDTDAKPVPVSILVYGTGHPMNFEPLAHIGSFTERSLFVWHVFLG